jgi:ABC-type lipoprotein export system ATPase subunit
MSQVSVRCEGLVHIYRSNGLEVVALQGLELEVQRGEMVAIVGRSGSGKTTLMNVLAGVEVPSAGRTVVEGHELSQLRDAERNLFRQQVVGYVWQRATDGLTPEITAAENVQVPLMRLRIGWRDRRKRAAELLEALGIGPRGSNRPAELSSGEQQRLAIAVALASQPKVLLADEPTGQLDSSTAQSVLEDLRQLQRELGTTVIAVTHDHQVERFADRVIGIRDGRTSTETRYVTREGQDLADELVILDTAGRLQLPPALVRELGLRGRVRVRREGDKLIIVSAAEEHPPPRGRP